MAKLFPSGYQFLDSNGDPVASGTVSFYQNGTTTVKGVFTDVDFDTAATNPAPLDAAGRFNQGDLYGFGTYTVVLKTSAGSQLWSRDDHTAGADLENTTVYELTTEIGANQHPGIITGHIVRTNYYDTNRIAGSGAQWRYTGTTTLAKAGGRDADGYIYDADGKQFQKIGRARVAAFGALLDGTDDKAAIQAAVASLGSNGGVVYWPIGKQSSVSSSVSINVPGVTFASDAPSDQEASVGCVIKYIGAQDNDLAILNCGTSAHNFSMENVFLDCNDLAGHGLLQQGITSPAGLTRGGYLKSVAFRGYRNAAWVIGDSTDTLNDAQFQEINAYDIRLLGAATGVSNVDGIHVNAQNLEFLSIHSLSAEATSGANREHRNHIRQIAGGVNLTSFVSTRAGLSSNYAIYSQDQLIINGWRTEDRLLVDWQAVAINMPCSIRNLIQRDISATAGTAGTDEVIRVNSSGGVVSFDNIHIQGSISLGSTTARKVSYRDVYFDTGNAAGTKGGPIFNGPQNQRGWFHDIDTGSVKLRGTSTEIELLDEDGTSRMAISHGGLFLRRFSPSDISANQNDYDPGVGSFFRLSATGAARTLTGIDPTAGALISSTDGRVLILVNVGTQDIVLANENASSAAANRIITGTGADVTLAAATDDQAMMIYDGATSRWRLIA